MAAAGNDQKIVRLQGAAIVLLVAVAVGLLPGIADLRFNSHYSVYFDADDPLLRQHQQVNERFSRGDSVFVVLEAVSGTMLDDKNYAAIERLSKDAGRLPGVVGIASVAAFATIAADDEGQEPDPFAVPGLDQLNLDDRVAGLLISKDGRIAGVRVDFSLAEKSAEEVLAATSALKEIARASVAGLPINLHYTGSLALNEAYIGVVRQDLKLFVPALLSISIVLLALFFRNARALAAIIPVGIVTIAGVLGFAGKLGFELAAINTFVPVIVMTISLAGCVHMVSSYNHYRAAGNAPDGAAMAAIRFNRLPLTLASVTTALGFLGLTFSPSPPVRVVGYTVAAGIVLSYLLCVTLLPALLARVDPHTPGRHAPTFRLRSVAGFVGQRSRAIVLVFVAAAVPAGYWVGKNVISDNVFEYFPRSHDFYRATALVDRHMSGINEVLYGFDSGERGGLFDVAVIDKLDAFRAWLLEQDEVLRVASLSTLPQIAEARSDGRLTERLAHYRETALRREAAPAVFRREVSPDFAATCVAVYLRQLDSSALVDFDQRARDWLGDHAAPLTAVGGTGPALMFAYLGERNIAGMLAALGLALAATAFVTGLVLRSAHAAWIGLVCNLFPVLAVYSLWALVDGRISIGAAVVMGMILGIVVDDTIYLLSTFRRSGVADAGAAAANALVRVGPALVITTITLVAGLSVGLLSEFGPIRNMSILSVTIIAVALGTDLLLLPALLRTAATRIRVQAA